MGGIFVLAEHRQQQLRDVTFEMLTKSRDLADKMNTTLTAVILGKNVKELAKPLTEYADKVLVVEHDLLENFVSDYYQSALVHLIDQEKPLLTMIAHSSIGMELAPRLAAALNIPLATDCIDLTFEDDRLVVTRQIYGGKINARVIVRKADRYIVTARQAAFKAQKPPRPINGQMIEVPYQPPSEEVKKRFLELVTPPPGAVDISSAALVVGIGRGIKDKSNIPMVEELAQMLGGVVGCSRPIVDKGWMPSDRQIGQSGKSIKPKVYLALGISGAFQHLVGMKGAEVVIAVNKDPNAPIFGHADYGVIDDLFKIVPALKKKIAEARGS
ncbi:MAG: electron transfer flavoprotein subunit alpha/FixB family protein [Candidatus Nezhaarchaeales archaeon]|nr:MAG: electron transfer flavoprotein subunit alpha/FixB family protein [Candidatus Nezhaarchaeota archaeon WYZ-LMO8]TDA37151.1 MAG: electron transfer flavoprotein subunit alpha/FixB family protein [Candidatus Nezhaarchaeota archaeon WYZ-LMO7]